MAPPTGNQYWKRRRTHGRGKLFRSADALWDACVEYFEWVEDNPLISVEAVKYQGTAGLVEVPKLRAMTLQGLCLSIGISLETWCQYRKPDHDFSDVVDQVDMIIRTQKFEGAAADLFNANIISRDLGLAEKQQNTTTVQAEDGFSQIIKDIAEQRFSLAKQAE